MTAGILRIVHVGGLSFVSQALAQAQSATGCEVLCLAPSSYFYTETELSTQLLSEKLIEFGQFDILQVHLPMQTEPAFLAELLTKTKGLFRSCCGFVYGQAASLNNPGQFSPELAQCMQHMFLANPELEIKEPSSYLGLPLDISKVELPELYAPALHETKLLFIPYLCSPEEKASITTCLEKINSRSARLMYAVLEAEDIPDSQHLIARLKECDIFLEGTNLQSAGPLATLAMLCGKTVIGGNSKEAQSRWKQLETSPLVHVSADTFIAKLDAILREPKSMRDLGKRSRQYVEKFHNSANIAALSLQVYKRLLG